MSPTRKRTSKKPIQQPVSDRSGDDEDYRNKRSRNNEAVKRSRVKQKERANETKGRVDNLRTENTKLEGRIEQKEKELKLLKGLFLEAAQIKSNSHPHLNLQKLLKDDDEDDGAQADGT